MNFAGIGPAELLLILIIALLIFGPAKLPQVAKDLGDTIQRWRQALEDITEDAGGQTPISPTKEAEIQASVQKVTTVKHKDRSDELTSRSDDEASAGEEAKQETEVETECQT